MPIPFRTNIGARPSGCGARLVCWMLCGAASSGSADLSLIASGTTSASKMGLVPLPCHLDHNSPSLVQAE